LRGGRIPGLPCLFLPFLLALPLPTVGGFEKAEMNSCHVDDQFEFDHL